MDKIAKLLEKNGPMISGDLARLYETTYGASNEAARKAISRAGRPVRKSAHLKFDKNQVFCYLESQYMGSRYASALLEAIKTQSKTCQTVINAFLAQGGFVSRAILPAFLGAPVENVRGHKLYTKIIEEMIQNNLIVEFNEDTYALNRKLFDLGSYSRSVGLELAKKNIVSDFARWAREINLAAYEKGRTLFESPIFAHFQWGYTAPSYVQPLYSGREEAPGFVVADVFFGKTATTDDLRFFLDKLSVIRSFKNLPRFFPVLLVDRITPEALRELKNQKVTVAILNNFFTDKYTELLNELVNLFANTTSIVNKNPQMIYKVFDELTRSEGRYNNMAGDMFELLVGCHYANLGCNSLKSKQIIAAKDGKYKELDWLIQRNGRTIVAECKAVRSKIDVPFVEKWLRENIPFTRRWLLENHYTGETEFQLWAVGGFTEAAEALLRQEEEANRKCIIRHYTRAEMIEEAQRTDDQSFLQVLREHFGEKG